MELDSGLFLFRTFQVFGKFDLQNSREAEVPVGGQRWDGVTPVTVVLSRFRKAHEKWAVSGKRFRMIWERECM